MTRNNGLGSPNADRRASRPRTDARGMETLPKRAPATTLADVVERVARACHVELRQLVERCAGADARARAAELARYAHRARQRLVRCAIVEQWSRKSAKIATVATNAHLTLRAHEEAFAKLADGLFHLHQQIEWAKAPAWDLAGALNVLCDGDYELGREISEIGVGRVAATEETEETEETRERRLDFERRFEEEMTERLVRSKTHVCATRDDHSEWPNEKFKVFAIGGGKVEVGVEGEYRATLSLGGPVAPNATEQPRYGGWRVETIEMLAGDEKGAKFELNKAETRKLADMACASMVGLPPFGQKLADDAPPLEPLHLKGLHGVASDAVLLKSAAAILAQAGALKDAAERANSESRWSRNAVKVEIVKGEAAGILKGVRVAFWRQNVASADEAGMLDVSFNPETADLRAKARAPGEAEFFDLPVNYARVDLEAILVEAIRIASSKKLHSVSTEVSGEKSFTTVVEESMTAEECACSEDEDAWGTDARPAIRLEISKFTNIFITCRISDGTLILHGAGELVPSATEADLSKRLALEGHDAIVSIVEEVSVAVEQQELKGLLRTSGTSVHPAPKTLGGEPWSTSDAVPSGVAPTALVPVVPSDGGVFVATWMGATPTFALVRAHRVNPASRYIAHSVEKLNLGARKGSKADVVVKMIGEACRDLSVDAQRSALMRALKEQRVPFVDIRPTSKGTKKTANTVSFEIVNTSRWAQSKYKRAIKQKSPLKAHVTLRGIDGLSASIGGETRAYEHSEFMIHAFLADVRRIAAAQGFLSALSDNDSGVDFAKLGCKLSRQAADVVSISYKDSIECAIEWRHSGYLGPGLYADGERLSSSAKRALSVAARDGRCEIFACALRAVEAAASHFAQLHGDFQLTFGAPSVLSIVRIIGVSAMRVCSIGFRLDGSVSFVVGRGGDGAHDDGSTNDDEMNITDDHEALIPTRPEGLTQYIDEISAALEGPLGSKPKHGDAVVANASSASPALAALAKSVVAK